MRKTALAATVVVSLLVGLASPAAADSVPTATAEWADETVPVTEIVGALGNFGATATSSAASMTSSSGTAVDWSTAEGSDTTSAGGVTSTSAVLVDKPLVGVSAVVSVSFSEPVVDPMVFIAHGTPGLVITAGLFTDYIESNNATGPAFTPAATGSVDDGLSMRYLGSRTTISFQASHPSATTFTMTVAVPSSIAHDVVAETVEDTPVVVAPTVTPAAGRTVDPSTTRLIDEDGDPVTSLTTADGTYTVDTVSGEITFTPTPGFTGTTAPVQYRVTDSAGIYAAAFLTVEVAPVVGVPLVDPLLLVGGAAVFVPAIVVIRRRRSATA